MPKILHLGIGNFHRAHQAWYTQLCNALGGETWRITGVSLRRPDMRDALAPQAFEYTLAIKNADGARYERMAVHDDVLVAAENPSAIVDQIANAETVIITLTVTEKGYHVDQASVGLDLDAPEISSELKSGTPQTAIGFIAHGLTERHRRGAGPVTIISCDNLAENGSVLEHLVRDFAVAAKMDLLPYLDEHVTFPNTMVDRIVPATTDALRNEVAQQTGVQDASPVSTEAFSEWVIEDRFAGSRPAWGKVGVTIVDDVQPFELRKLRLLNGAHSLLAYSGLLAGHTYVHEAVADPALRALAEGLMAEAGATLPVAIQHDVPAYRAALFERFANPALNHELAQIAMDGSLKLPVRIVPVLAAQKTGASVSFAARALAYWLAYILRRLDAGAEIHDPAAADFQRLKDQNKTRQELAEGLLDCLGAVPQRAAIVEQALSL